MRQRYFVMASSLYIAVGVIILARSAVSHVYAVALLGFVFIALGAVRLRDYRHRDGARH